MEKEVYEIADELLNKLIDSLSLMHKELDKLNKILRKDVKSKKGEFYFKPKDVLQANFVIKNFEEREDILQLIRLVPELKVLEKIKYLLENNYKIGNKYYTIMQTLLIDEAYYYGQIFTLIFDEHNERIKEEEQISKEIKEYIHQNNQKKFKRKESKIKEELPVPLVNVSEVLGVEDVKEEKSNYSLYCFSLLESSNTYELFGIIIKKLIDGNKYKEINEIRELIYEEMKSNEEVDDNKAINKLSLLNELLSYNQNKDIPEEPQKNISNQLFFATKQKRIYVQEDVKDISEEFIKNSYRLLEALKNNDFTGFETKKFVNNKRLGDLWEVKIYGVRLYYRYLGKNNIYVLKLDMKKSMNDKLLTDQLKLLLITTAKEYNNIRYKVSKDLIDQEEIDKQNTIYEDIQEQLMLQETHYKI